MSDQSCILLFVPQPCFRLGLAQALREDPRTADLRVLEASDFESANLIITMQKPTLMVADISGARTSVVELTRFARCADTAPKVLVISPYDQPYLVKKAFEAKASGYILASTTAEELVRAVITVLAGEHYLDPILVKGIVGIGTAGSEMDPTLVVDSVPKLTPREIEVLKRVAYGFSAKEIARDLNLSQKSVETYKTRGAAKMQLESRAQIVAFANHVGWFAFTH